MYYTIYKITNLINDKIYIGKHITYNPYDNYMGSGLQIKAAIKKYGKINFKKEVLFIFNSKLEMNNKEKELVTEDFCKRLDTYNMHEGGEGGFAHVRSSLQYKEWCQKGAKNSSGRYHSNWGKFKFKINDPLTKNLSKKANLKRILIGVSFETRSKISLYQKNNNSMKNRCWCIPIDCNDYSQRKVFHKDKIPSGWISCKDHRDKLKAKTGTYNKFWIFNPELKQNKYSSGDIPEGWYKGRKLEYYQKASI